MVNLEINIGALKFKNPVTLASGTSGYGREIADFYDVSKLGGIFLKGITPRNRDGNLYPRMAETASGMLNAVGLQNKGVDYFLSDIYPEIKDYNTCLIPNVNGGTIEDYLEVVDKLSPVEGIEAIELNISCPNVKEGGMAFGTSCEAAEKVIKAVRKAYNKVLIVKLSPNVTKIGDIAKVAENEGADAVSLVNTLVGMAVDSNTRKPLLSTVTGGLSGPAIKPIALRMVWEVSKAVDIPVIGMGGIMTTEDALEFLIAGASVVQVGTALFKDPFIPLNILNGIETYLQENKMNSINELIGSLQL